MLSLSPNFYKHDAYIPQNGSTDSHVRLALNRVGIQLLTAGCKPTNASNVREMVWQREQLFLHRASDRKTGQDWTQNAQILHSQQIRAERLGIDKHPKTVLQQQSCAQELGRVQRERAEQSRASPLQFNFGAFGADASSSTIACGKQTHS